MPSLTRRDFLTAATTAVVASQLVPSFAIAQDPPATSPTNSTVDLHWLEGTPAQALHGTCFTTPFARGAVKQDATFAVQNADSKPIASQSWPLAYWPDGSIKWAAHVIGPTDRASAGYRIAPGTPTAPLQAVTVEESEEVAVVNTGLIRATIRRKGQFIVDTIERTGKPALLNGRLIAMRQDHANFEDAASIQRETFLSQISKVTVEQSGPLRAVVKIEGVHRSESGRDFLPAVVRLYFHAGSDAIRIMHSFIYDGDEFKDHLCGIGLQFDVPMRDELYNRHIRLIGENSGLFGEAVRTVTGLRRDPGDNPRAAQIEGKPTPAASSWDRRVSDRLNLIPAWGDFSLTQLSSDGFEIKKRTKAGFGWIKSAAGRRAAGVGYVGSPSGGVAFGLRDFWQKYPAQIDLRNLQTDRATITLWMLSPSAPAQDMRFYHDEMGMETYPAQTEGLNITYEDYEPHYGTPYGIARSSEIWLQCLPATPSRESLVQFADQVRKPAMLACQPKTYLDANIFGGIWTMPDSSKPVHAIIEEELKYHLDAYVREIDQRRWYGFWDYGDVMHSYDGDRHEWRYDVGGFAWDNSELSTDLWLWLSFLRTGRADIFRLAEAMTRHTCEVDVYHIGRFKGLGTRHGVQHWADSSKQSRISTPLYRRPFYFLTGDERVGDLLREQLHTIETEKKIVVGRKLGANPQVLPLPAVDDPAPGGEVELGDLNYGNAMSAWITEAERTSDPKWHAKIIQSMQGVGDLKFGFFHPRWTVNIDTGEVKSQDGGEISPIGLSCMFGLPEIVAELLYTYGEHAPKFADAWAQYGRLYNGSQQDRQKELGTTFKNLPLGMEHSRVMAFASLHDKNTALAERAWKDFFGNRTPQQLREGLTTTRIEGPNVLNPIVESQISTNYCAQRALTAMQNLKYIGQNLE